MSDHDTQIRELVERDPGQVPPPDLARLRGAGRRTLARRRLGLGTAALAMTVAVLAPAYVVVTALSDGSDGAPEPLATDPPAATTSEASEQRERSERSEADCGVLTCTEGNRERAASTGEPLVVSSGANADEVVYAADGTLMIGHRRGGELFRSANLIPVDGDVRFWSNVGVLDSARKDRLVVLGVLDGAPGVISWESPEGQSGTVDLTSTDVVPGATVFVLTAPLPEGYRPSTFERVRTADGGRAVKVTPGSDHPELTIRTSDGWSCTLAECGSLG